MLPERINLTDVIPTVGANGIPDPRTAPISAYRYADAKRDLIDMESRERPLIRLWDNQHKYVGTLASEQSLNAEELLHDTGQCDIVVRADDWLLDFMRRDVRKDEDLHITIDPYPRRRNWRWRYGAKITNVRVKRAEDGLRTITLECSHNREHWKHLLFGATPFCDPAVQPLRAWLLPGNTRTIIATTAFINLARNYWPILALPTQALNPGAWTGQASRLSNLNPLNFPLQVQFVNPIFDQSRFSVIMSRWSDAHSVTESMLRDAGCHVRAYTWLPEDEDSPHPELAAIVGQAKARPTRACVVLAVEDSSGVTGPTGTLIDGALNFLAATGDSLVTENLIPVDSDGDGVTDPLIRKWLGVAPAVPSIAFRDTERSSIVSSEHSMFRSKAQKIFTGGKSPGWVNQLQCVAGDTMIDSPDGKERIDALAERGDSFRVWSLTPDGRRVAAVADHAFKKGTAELFRYTLDDGRSITTTAQHRFLTDQGFMHGADITIGARIATADESDRHCLIKPRQVTDEQYVNMPETWAVKYRAVASIEYVGVADFYDMHVPGWENYLAHGFWNHNTFAIKYALSQISYAVQTLAGPELTAVETPGSPGLEEIYQCVAGDTVIDSPDGKERIDALAERGDSFRVWSLTPNGQRVPATAQFAFKKGTAELFEYVLDNGQSITATARHRFLTDRGFIVASEIELGTLMATDDGCGQPVRADVKTVTDEQYVCVKESDSVSYRAVVAINAVGMGDYFDMFVPGWHNYLAHGIWNHNSQFDNILLAYISITDPVRASRSGPYGYLEHFEQGSGSAYTISSALSLREGHYKTRPYQGFKVAIRNGGQYSLYYDLDLGTRCHFEIDGIFHTDQVTAIKLHYDQTTPKTFDLAIGDDRESENPMAAATRAIANIWNAVGMLFGSGDMF